MKTDRMTAMAALALSALTLAACGGGEDADDGGTTITTPDGSVTVNDDDDGTMTFRADGAEAVVKTGTGNADNLPKGFTAYPGAKITMSVEGNQGGKSGGMIAMETSAPPEKVIAFYKKQAENAGLEIESEGKFSGSHMLGARSDALGVNVVANGGDDKTQVQIAYGTEG
ncbi:hypothetical protein [Croceicoccus sp. Ery5]|uniref:hypothetical protein n=1 Tax=Croceicoccus sp. Ery5 TaxID=1703340 RepID=UPI001E357664|nr:hypothetical protein [Croceicoccus sp. Ery5]